MFIEDKDDVSRVYDTHLLMGHFMELDSSPNELILKMISEGDEFLSEAKTKKNSDKILSQINAIIKYLSALSLHDKCLITDIEGLFSFICIRHPELELDWTTLQRVIMHSQSQNIEYQEQKTMDVAMTIYISAIKKQLNEYITI